MNLGPLEYKAGVLITWLRRSVGDLRSTCKIGKQEERHCAGKDLDVEWENITKWT
jgi:hypothetical protein